MSDSLLLFTFSPIQSFIAEARRAEDLFNGSAILSELAKAAAEAIGLRNLIYPAPPLTEHTPNMLVAHLQADKPEEIAKNAKTALETRWSGICHQALQRMKDLKIPTDEDTQVWQKIWSRQIDPQTLWEVYWVVVPFGEKGYSGAYKQAGRALNALKRSRLFKPMNETGQKDSLGGKRAALRTMDFNDAKAYWTHVAGLPNVFPSKIRPDGRERLDAVGAVKRFAELKDRPFDSTSTVAAADFLELAKGKAKDKLEAYRKLFETPAFARVFRPREKVDQVWPYDGDLLYEATLTKDRFKEDYNFEPAESDLRTCRELLKKIYEACEDRPSPYYAIIVLDGDRIGKRIDKLVGEEKPLDAHRAFSGKLGEFSAQVEEILKEHHGFLVYNGGDDVMCMAPLSTAVSLAKALAEAFKNTMQEYTVTASAGIAIAHHQWPLDFAIEEARRAEKAAKNDKNDENRGAVCVRVDKRGGEPLEVRSQWDDLNTIVEELRKLFADGVLSSRLAYAVQREAPVLSLLEPEARQSMLKVLLTRHSAESFKEKEAEDWAKRLNEWAGRMDAYLPHKKDSLENDAGPAGFTEMADWLILARFLSQRGGE